MSVTELSPALRRQVLDLARDNKGRIHCAWCRKAFPPNAVQIDHVWAEIDSTPEARSDPANLQVLCAPKGSTRFTSCHKRKTAQEARERANRNRPPRRWLAGLVPIAVAVVPGGYAVLTLNGGDPIPAAEFLQYSEWAGAIALSTYLVQKGFRHRAPQRAISAESIAEDAPREVLNTNRIIEASREIVGQKGTVSVRADSFDDFTLTYAGTEFADHDDEKKLELLKKIQAKIGDRWLPWWDTQRDLVRFTRRPALPSMIRHPGLAPERTWNILPIADGVAFNLLTTSHLLIVGATNAGKTALMRTIIVAVADSAARDGNTELLLADPKQFELAGFKNWAGVRKIVTGTSDLWDMAFDLEAEMNDRAAMILAKRVPEGGFKRLIVVIDEYEQYYKRMHRHWLNGKDQDGKPLKKSGQRVPGAIDAIQSVLSMARRMGIHLIIGTQSPDATWFGGTGTRENLAGRATVGPVDGVRSKMMFGDASWGRDVPAELKGRTTIQVGNGMPEEAQVYYTPDPFDFDQENTDEDWATLRRLGMPA